MVGQLYLVETTIYSLGNDPAADRRAVVITVPPGPESKGPIQIITRTSRKAPGVAHPADLSIRCDRNGVFSSLASVEQQLWRPGNVQLLGVLPEPYLARVLERFG
jgi:hypothetical protein